MAGGRPEKVAVIAGDGIGPEVMEGALAVLDAVGADLEIVPVEVGYARWKRSGQAMADEDLETLLDVGCVLFGAITTPPDPSYKSVLLRIRKELDLYANIRPFGSERINLTVVRENTEGLYSGVEEVGEERATSLRVITRRGSERVAKIACDVAAAKGRLTVVHKSNVLKSDTLFLRTCREVAERRKVPCDDMLVDAAAYNLVKDPQRFDVIVTTNLFGDILSDECAGILGSLGLCASANLGEERALFEPIHGSAPDIAGKGIANPVGMIRSAAMMIDWLGRREEAARIEDAVQGALARGLKTPDLGGTTNTREMAAAVVALLEEAPG